MAKIFQKQQPKGEVKNVNLLGALLSDDDDDDLTMNSVIQEKPTNVKEVAPEPKPSPLTVERPKREREVKPKVEVVVQTDKRKVEDKKVPFTNSMRGSILQDIDDTILAYRKKVDIDYNMAKFLEDASLAQLEVLRRKIK